MNKRLHKLMFGTANQRQRYSIRKLTIGAASVLLGTTFLFGAGQIVQADTTGQESEQEEETVQLDENINKDETAKATQSTNVGDAGSQTDVNTQENTKVEVASRDAGQAEDELTQKQNDEVPTSSDTSKEVNTSKQNEVIEATKTASPEENSKDDPQAEVAKNNDESTAAAAKEVGKTQQSNDLQAENDSGKESSSKTTQTLKVTKGAPLPEKALGESKVEDPVTVTINLHGKNQYRKDEIVKSFTYRGTSNNTLQDVGRYVQEQINKDSAGFNVADSPLVQDYRLSKDFMPGHSYKFMNDPELKSEYEAWYADKRKNHLLAGYTINLRSLSTDPLVNGQTYNLNLGEKSILTEFPLYHRLTRTINYIKYGLSGDTFSSVVQDGTSNMHHSPNTVVQEYNREKDNHNELVYATMKRTYNSATGIPNGQTDEYGDTGTFIIFQEKDNPQFSNWSTPDPNVNGTVNPGDDLATLDDIPAEGEWYAIIGQELFHGYGDDPDKMEDMGKDIFEVHPINITYYHNQPVDFNFEDISTNNPQDLSGNNYSATDKLTYNNTSTNPYKVQIKSNDKLQGIISNLKEQGYELVSIDNDDNPNTDIQNDDSVDLTYDKDNVWKSKTGGDNVANLKHKTFTIKLRHKVVKNQTITTSATRTVHYVADKGDGQYDPLQDPKTQTINFTLTGSVDLATNSYTDPSNNQQYKLTKNNDGTYTMDIADASKVSGWQTTDKLDKVQQDKITKSDGTVWVIDHASEKTADGTKLDDKFAPELDSVSAKKYDDIYLVYNRETASYKIHYIDVNGSTKSDGFTAHDGTELTSHEIRNVSGYVGESSDPTKLNLWNFTNDGYVLVDASGNVKGADGNVDISKLGKQEFIEGMGDNNDHDQYVYLKHAVEEITPETSDSAIPKDPSDPTKPSVDKSTLSKTFTRTIYYKANTADGATLKDATTQKVTFEGSIYIDKVTHKTTTPTTIKVNGEDVQVATTNPGSITWNKVIVDDGTPQSGNSATLSAIDQPTITLNSGDPHATSNNMVGTWKLVNGKADAVDLTPSSSAPQDVKLVYEKEVQPGGNTGDQPSGEPSGNPGNEPSSQPDDKGSKTPGKPDENKPDEPKKDNTKKPEEKKSNKKTPSKKSTKKSPTKSNKTKQTKQTKQSQKSPKPAKRAVNKTSNNAPRAENMYRNNSPLGEDMYRNNAPTPESDNVTMPKSEVIDQTSGKPAGLVDNTTVGANGETVNGTTATLPQTGEKQSDAAAFGLIALAFAGLASFVGVDRKKKNN